MAHIGIEEGIPGILGPMMLRPETTKPLRELAEVLSRSDNSLSSAERETIAASIDAVKSDFKPASVSPQLKALLAIAGKVQLGGEHGTVEDIAGAQALGASDREIYDTVLIAATFYTFNRYVDGLAT